VFSRRVFTCLGFRRGVRHRQAGKSRDLSVVRSCARLTLDRKKDTRRPAVCDVCIGVGANTHTNGHRDGHGAMQHGLGDVHMRCLTTPLALGAALLTRCKRPCHVELRPAALGVANAASAWKAMTVATPSPAVRPGHGAALRGARRRDHCDPHTLRLAQSSQCMRRRPAVIGSHVAALRCTALSVAHSSGPFSLQLTCARL
jgi:hypothetical protein